MASLTPEWLRSLAPFDNSLSSTDSLYLMMPVLLFRMQKLAFREVRLCLTCLEHSFLLGKEELAVTLKDSGSRSCVNLF